MKILTSAILSATLTFVAAQTHAEENTPIEPNITKAWDLVADYFPDIKKGEYETRDIDHGNVIFLGPNSTTFVVNPESSLVMTGNTYFLQNGKVRNVNDDILSERRKSIVSQLNLDDAIRFKPTGETKAVLYTFIDVDCGYCRKLHAEIPALNTAGIEVAYFPFPRSEPGSPTWQKMITAWCSDEKQNVIQRLYAGETIPEQNCQNSDMIAKYKDLGKDLGVSGTPASVTAKGTFIPGYRSAAEFISASIGE
jgi:thiol:disulfide interchange protein DsbC